MPAGVASNYVDSRTGQRDVYDFAHAQSEARARNLAAGVAELKLELAESQQNLDDATAEVHGYGQEAWDYHHEYTNAFGRLEVYEEQEA